MTTSPHAKFGAAAFTGASEKLPDVFPRTIGPNAGKYVQEVVASGLTCDMLSRFEKAFAKALGVKHFVGTPGCTPALQALMSAVGYEPGDEIIVSPVADYGTLAGLVYEGYIPVFADTAPGTAHITAQTIERCITNRTRAILVVHVVGHTCDMDPIVDLARRRGLDVFEDVCQAVFAQYKGRVAGTLGKASGFSFDGEKTMGSDIGGGVATDDDAFAERLRFMAHARGAISQPGFGRVHTHRGQATRMTNTTAGICLAQLEIIHDQVRNRDHTARLLTRLLSDIPGITCYPIPEHCTLFSTWMYGFSIDPRAFRCSAADFARQLTEAGVPNCGLGRYYLMPDSLTFLHEFAAKKKHQFAQPPASRSYVYSGDQTPNARAFLENFVRWFWTEKYTDAHVATIHHLVRSVAERNRA